MDLITAITGNRPLRLALAFLAGASTALAFAPYDIWPLYPIAIALTLMLGQNLGPRAAFGHWFSFGVGAFIFGISWVHVSIDRFGGLPLPVSLSLMAVLALYLALYPALAGSLFARLQSHHPLFNHLLLFPALWILCEWGRGWVVTGFPWLWAGYSQADGPLLPLASLVGVQGLGLLLIMSAGAVALANQKIWQPLLLLPLLMSLAVYLTERLPQTTRTGDTAKVALVQGNIPQSMKWVPEQLWPTLLKYRDLTREILDADIVIWPEAAIPAPEDMVADFLDATNQEAGLRQSAIVTGIISRQDENWYNSLIVLGNHHSRQQDSPDYRPNSDNEYRKHHLLPIGEFVPLASLLKPLAPLFNLPMSSFSRGEYRQVNLQAAGLRIAPAICYEIAFPEQLRDNIDDDTDLLLTVSNDAWFGESNGPLQHMEIARLRAAELGRPLLRATNNGVTAIVDEYGQISHRLPQFETQVLSAEVPLVSGKTLFARTGHLPLYIICGLILLLALWIRRSPRHGSK